jgi:hypothetical protein
MNEDDDALSSRAEDVDGEFRVLNERARMLAERALFHGDRDAGRELQVMFSPLIGRMRRSVREAHRDDLAAELTACALRALKQAVLKRKDLPVAYALASIRHEYIRQCARLQRQDETHRPTPEGFDAPAPFADPASTFDAGAVLAKIDEFRREARDSRSKIDVVLAEVVAVCYLNGASFVDGCTLLSLTAEERKSLRERLSKSLVNPDSRLSRLRDQLRRIIGGLIDDETLPPRSNSPRKASEDTDERRSRREDGRES